MTREEFVKKYWPVMVSITAGTGIFPEVMMAQSIIESQGNVNGVYMPGQSTLSKLANNYFGIKSSSQWGGQTVTLKTGEVYNGHPVIVSGIFRKYISPEDSFIDYVHFLKSNPRYTAAGVFTAKTPQEQSKALLNAGYATNPSYANMIDAVAAGIKKYIPAAAAAGGAALIVASLFFLIYKNK